MQAVLESKPGKAAGPAAGGQDRGDERLGDEADGSHASPERIAQLAEGLSARVSGAIGEIGSITTHQRVLSLNAQIEAARAGGPTGAAFAVVAGAMQELAEKTAAVAQQMAGQTATAVQQLTGISRSLATDVRGTRLADLALTNIDLIDRNLYERSCDVRWWATDASCVDACAGKRADACAYASKRLGVILSAYTVYLDLVLCDTAGRVIANGRPGEYRSVGATCAAEPWFKAAMHSATGDEFGFRATHECPLVNGKRALVYSCGVRAGGEPRGRLLGVLGIVFNWDGLAQTVVENTPVEPDKKQQTRVCIVDERGLVLADTAGKQLKDTLRLPKQDAMFKQPKGFAIETVEGRTCCIAHAASPGFETYRTGWHSVIVQHV